MDLSVRQWLAALSQEPIVYLQLQATEITGKVVTHPEVDCWFYSTSYPTLKGPRQSLKVRITYSPDTTSTQPVTKIIVGDEVNLWSYDAVSNTYSASPYGDYQFQQPDTYFNTFFRYLGAMCTDYLNYPATFLSQTYSAAGTSYQTWLPNSNSFLDTLGNANYTIGTPPTQNVIFVQGADPLNSLQTIVSQVQFDNIQNKGGLYLQRQWTMTVTPLSVIDPSTFKFVPPRGARLITGPRLAVQ